MPPDRRRLPASPLLALAACAVAACATTPAPGPAFEIVGPAEVFAPDVASTRYAEIRLTLSPDGRNALWFSRDRPGGAGGYDIWMSRRTATGWAEAMPVAFNTPGRDFDPAFSVDGRFVYFCSDRPGGQGADDLWRVAFDGERFGRPEPLGPAVNSAGREFAPMVSARGVLLFASDGHGGAGRFDLFTARARDGGFEAAQALPGAINTPADEFDATFLADGESIVFSRAPDMRNTRVDLFHAALRDGGYEAGSPLPAGVNSDKDAYGPMLDWSRPDRLTFSTRGPDPQGMDLYVVRYRTR